MSYGRPQILNSAAVVAIATAAAGCGTSRTPTTRPLRRSAQTTIPRQVPVEPLADQEGRASVKRGTLVPRDEVSGTAFTAPAIGYGLGLVGTLASPVETRDGGRSWRVAGPLFFAGGDGSGGSLAVSEMLALGRSRVIAWGSGGFVDWTCDGGRSWNRSGLGPWVEGVGPAPGTGIFATVGESGVPGPYAPGIAVYRLSRCRSRS